MPIDPRDANDLSAWERWIGHAGYVSEGMLYLLIGAFALLAALDASRRPKGTQGVLVRLSLTALGDLLLAAVALGLASFVTWQLLVAIRDPEHRRDRDQRSRRIPVIDSGPFGFEHVDAAAQRRDPDSLLNWTERIIRMRKEVPTSVQTALAKPESRGAFDIFEHCWWTTYGQ